MKTSLLFLSLALTGIVSGQSSALVEPTIRPLGSPLVNYSQFSVLADSVEHYRENRLISAPDFVAFSKEKNTIILDTRSKAFFDKKHVKGAINLPFADFTQASLQTLIPDKNTRILIYCNNNFMADIDFSIEDPSFASKQGKPQFNIVPQFYLVDSIAPKIKFLVPKINPASDGVETEFQIPKSYTLALNIPTFINLYGYGYTNVYELKDMIATSSSGELQFEGTEVKLQSPENSFSYLPVSSPLVSYSDLQELIDLVQPYREKRLISLDKFNEMKSTANTVILDTRSKEMYDEKHVKGAIHLEFSEFTQSTLDALMNFNRNTRILIYCNNNFITDLQKMQQDRYFMSKVAGTPPQFMSELTLALNIPTFINLYGYGYQNVYELNELVVTSDPRIQFEGTAVLK